MEFTGVVVAIPGGTGGLGLAVTLSFLRAGATVVTTCMVPPEQDRLAKGAGGQSSLRADSGRSAHAASRADELVLTPSLAEELKPYRINVNSVLPSISDTESNRQAMPNSDHSLWPKPEAIAKVILFLCSQDAEVIHGAAIPVYGRV